MFPIRAHHRGHTLDKIGGFARSRCVAAEPGLRRYKEKLDPTWSPRYLVCASGAALPGVLTDLAALILGAIAAAMMLPVRLRAHDFLVLLQ